MAKKTKTKKTSLDLANDLVAAAYAIIESADDSGFSSRGDLIVTSKKAVKKLNKALYALKRMGQINP